MSHVNPGWPRSSEECFIRREIWGTRWYRLVYHCIIVDVCTRSHLHLTKLGALVVERYVLLVLTYFSLADEAM